jgi:hypothetical protein
MTTVVGMAGKARQVLRLTSPLTTYLGEDTIGRIFEENRGSAIFPLCRNTTRLAERGAGCR